MAASLLFDHGLPAYARSYGAAGPDFIDERRTRVVGCTRSLARQAFEKRGTRFCRVPLRTV